LTEKTKNRHRFYCRSKHSKGQQPPPKRSCVPCVRAKTRCDIQPGECVRCELKGLKCKWPPRAGDLQSTELNRSNQSQPELKTASTDLVQRSFSPPIPIRGDRLGIGSTSAFPLTDYNIGVSPSTRSQDMIGIPPALDSSCPAIDSPFSHFGEKQLDLEAISARLAEYGAPYSSFHFTGTSGPHFPHLPQQVSSRNALRAFQYRPLSNSSQRQSAGTLSRLLSSYPTTMLRQATFPPFIHPQCVPDIEGNPPPLKPLVKCVELAHAFKYRTLENSEMVWKAIRTEHERLWNEVCILAAVAFSSLISICLLYT
jgi:hypothetical protein